jgi:predicted nucleic acid-binding protein
MSGFLLDTNVISELVTAKPEPKVTAWLNETEETLLYLSVLTIAEIRKGVTSLLQSARRIALEAWLDHEVMLRFSHRILPVDLSVADRWGRIAGSAAAKKSPVPVIDGLLAATALHHNLIFVTRNTRDLAATGATLFNPWTD